MIATLRHRGPDDTGIFTDGPAALAAARLSIIDVAGGHQPLSIPEAGSPSRRTARSTTTWSCSASWRRRARTCAPSCDTEVIGHLYARDARTRVHAVARDVRDCHLGSRTIGSSLWHATASARSRSTCCRPSASCCSDPRPRPFSPCWNAHPRSFGPRAPQLSSPSATSPATTRCSRACRARAGFLDDGDARTGASTSDRYWTWPASPDRAPLSHDEAVERLRAELTEAVRIRLRSDVPLGAFLSGGIDSAAVLALMTQMTSKPVQTFTIGFGDPDYDELRGARETATHFGADHEERIVTPDCVERRRDDSPGTTTSRSPMRPRFPRTTSPSSRVARSRSCLTGDGGDELFAGYRPYAQALARAGAAGSAALRRLIGVARRSAAVARARQRRGSRRWRSGPKPGSSGAGPSFRCIC